MGRRGEPRGQGLGLHLRRQGRELRLGPLGTGSFPRPIAPSDGQGRLRRRRAHGRRRQPDRRGAQRRRQRRRRRAPGLGGRLHMVRQGANRGGPGGDRRRCKGRRQGERRSGRTARRPDGGAGGAELRPTGGHPGQAHPNLPGGVGRRHRRGGGHRADGEVRPRQRPGRVQLPQGWPGPDRCSGRRRGREALRRPVPAQRRAVRCGLEPRRLAGGLHRDGPIERQGEDIGRNGGPRLRRIGPVPAGRARHLPHPQPSGSRTPEAAPVQDLGGQRGAHRLEVHRRRRFQPYADRQPTFP